MVKRGLLIMSIIVFFLSTYVFSSQILELQITQIEHKKPGIKVYFNIYDETELAYNTSLTENDVIVRLNNETIEEGELSRSTDEPNNCLFLIDISKSLAATEMEEIQNYINSWINSMESNDSAGIVSFGDEVVVLSSLTNNRDELLSVVDSLERTDNSTAFYDGIDKGIQMITQNENSLQGRNMLIVFSDGLDEDVGAITFDEVQDKLSGANISVYGVATASISSGADEQYLDDFAYLTRISGGSFYENEDFEEAFTQLRELLNNEWCYSFSVENNIIYYDQQMIDLSVEVNGAVLNDSKSYVDNMHIKDDIAPSVVDIHLSDEGDYIIVTFSEPVISLDELEQVTVSKADESPVEVYQIENISEMKYAISIEPIDVDIYVHFNDLVDQSMEQNKLDITTYFLEVETLEVVDENVSIDEEIVQSEETEKFKIKWFVLTAVVLVIVSIILVIILKKKRQRGLYIKLNYVNMYMNRSNVFKCNLLNSSVQVGRSKRCNVLVNDSELSREHFQIFFNEGYIFLKDLESQNGTYWNDKKIEESTIINNGDVIKAGKTTFQFEIV